MRIGFGSRRRTNGKGRLRRNPNDLNLWMEFVNFQDEIGELKSKKLLERKISILKKAIELNFDVKLILEHLRLAEEMEESSTLMRIWEGYLKRIECSSEFFTLSMEYLNFRQRRFLAFNFEQVNEAFSDIFKTFKCFKSLKVEHMSSLCATYFEFLIRCGF